MSSDLRDHSQVDFRTMEYTRMNTMMRIEKRYGFFVLLVLCSAIYTSSAQAIDAIPGNVVAPPPDYSGFMASVISVQTGDKYVQGRNWFILRSGFTTWDRWTNEPCLSGWCTQLGRLL